jgi:hypothetical protein
LATGVRIRFPALGTNDINDLAQFLSSISKAKKRETYREPTVFSGKFATKICCQFLPAKIHRERNYCYLRRHDHSQLCSSAQLNEAQDSNSWAFAWEFRRQCLQNLFLPVLLP